MTRVLFGFVAYGWSKIVLVSTRRQDLKRMYLLVARYLVLLLSVMMAILIHYNKSNWRLIKCYGVWN
jgi:hypothetical protein